MIRRELLISTQELNLAYNVDFVARFAPVDLANGMKRNTNVRNS